MQLFSDTGLVRPAWALVLVHDGYAVPMERIQVDSFPEDRGRTWFLP